MATKKKAPKKNKKTVKSTTLAINVADKQTAEAAITARKRRHAGIID